MSAFDDLVQQVNDLSDNFDSYTSDNDSNIDDLQTNAGNDEQNITDLQSNSGQLTFPLSQDTVDLIKSVFPSGFATLSAGTVTVTDPRVSTTSVIMLTNADPLGTHQGVLSYVASAGSFTITSNSTTDDSIVAWVLFS